jgi:hypothetical protein
MSAIKEYAKQVVEADRYFGVVGVAADSRRANLQVHLETDKRLAALEAKASPVRVFVNGVEQPGVSRVEIEDIPQGLQAQITYAVPLDGMTRQGWSTKQPGFIWKEAVPSTPLQRIDAAMTQDRIAQLEAENDRLRKANVDLRVNLTRTVDQEIATQAKVTDLEKRLADALTREAQRTRERDDAVSQCRTAIDLRENALDLYRKATAERDEARAARHAAAKVAEAAYQYFGVGYWYSTTPGGQSLQAICREWKASTR